LFADQVLKQATERVTEETHTGTFDYADDIDLVVCSASELQESMHFWCAVLTDNGLKLNTSKLEVMVVSRVSEELHAHLRERTIERFMYLQGRINH